MTYHGVIQTGDVDSALTVAMQHMTEGRHIFVQRHEYKDASLCYRFSRCSLNAWPEGAKCGPEAECYQHEHDSIEYEVYADINLARRG